MERDKIWQRANLISCLWGLAFASSPLASKDIERKVLSSSPLWFCWVITQRWGHMPGPEAEMGPVISRFNSCTSKEEWKECFPLKLKAETCRNKRNLLSLWLYIMVIRYLDIGIRRWQFVSFQLWKNCKSCHYMLWTKSALPSICVL